MSVTNEDIHVIFHIEVQYRRHYEKSAKLHQMNREGVMWPTFAILGAPSFIFRDGWS